MTLTYCSFGTSYIPHTLNSKPKKPRSPSTLASLHFSLHPHEIHIEPLLESCLKIASLELVPLRIVGKRVGAAGVIRSAQLDENIQLRAVARGFGLGDVNG